MIMPFVRLYTRNITDANYDIPLLGMLFILNALLYNLKTPQGMLIISAGHYKETRLQVTIQGSLAVVVGVLLAPSLGLSGILLGSVISNAYRDIDLFFYIPKNVTGLPISKTLKKVGCMIVEIILICLPLQYFKLECNSYFQWILQAIVVTIYASLVVLLIGGLCNQQELKGTCRRIAEIRRRFHGTV